jgi:hypothetical protein
LQNGIEDTVKLYDAEARTSVTGKSLENFHHIITFHGGAGQNEAETFYLAWIISRHLVGRAARQSG